MNAPVPNERTGTGAIEVTSVGINTEWGLLMTSISEDNGEETPLELRLNGVVTFIGMVGLVLALVVLVVLLARYFTGHSKNPDESVQFIKIFTVAESQKEDPILYKAMCTATLEEDGGSLQAINFACLLRTTYILVLH
ncbi:unnamed protein product [Lactuca saligna]|uniref:Uncharacterized protein n=1 Tax=Lactuca saligna TaxID=75948 RepID=A0AA36DY37_LACSI|nr:unnamed protein product [Lactuca saligna]